MLRMTMELFRHFREMIPYFVISFVLFAVGIAIGATYTPFHELLDSQLEQLSRTASQLNSMKNAEIMMMVFIFINNTVKSIAIVFLGAAFAVVPIFFLVFNGMVIGYLLMTLDAQGVSVIEVVVKGLLPHGVLEIPAIVIAAAYGIRFGMLVLRKCVPSLWGKREIVPFLQMTLPLMLFLTIVLFAAALIEVTLTPWLLQL